jgi:hypothetical protein
VSVGRRRILKTAREADSLTAYNVRMQRVLMFFRAAGRWGIGLMTGGLGAYLLALYEHVSGRSLSAFVWVSIGAALFIAGAFFAWNEQFSKAMLAGNPEILVEYDKRAMDVAAPALVVRSLGGGNAYRVKIQDLHSGNAIATFDEFVHLEERQSCQANAKFSNFELPTPFFADNFAVFLRMADDDSNVMEAIEQELAPRIINVVVDYFNVSDMRFTAEFEIRSTYAWEEAHVHLLKRYFNPK